MGVTHEPEPAAEELRKGRDRAHEYFQEKIMRIRGWLADPRLKSWLDKIEALSSARNPHPCFFALFGDERSVRAQMRKRGAPQAYLLYSLESMAMHGSTVEQFFMIDDSSLTPKLQPDQATAERHLESIVSCCNHSIYSLASIDQRILSRPELRD